MVTGAGRGAGRSIALLLAEEGASVVVNDLGCALDGRGSSHSPADRVAEQIRSMGGSAVASYDDVALMDGGEGLVKSALDSFGRVDILANCVAVSREGHFHEVAPQDFDQIVRSNVKGTFVPTKYAAAQFRRQRSGRIVNVTTDAGLGDIGHSSDAAASEAIIGMTRSVARDLGKYGVTCNAIAHDATDEDAENTAALAVLLCTDAVPNVNGYLLGVREGSIFLYSNPAVERSVHRWGTFSMEEMDALSPAVFVSNS